MKSLSGHVALVTGASGSIGAEVSRTLAGLGAAVAVHGRRQETLDELARGIQGDGGTATAYVGDVRDAGHLETVVTDVASTLGTIDILVTLAGGDGSPIASATLEPERWRSVIETDLTSVFLAVHAVLPGMIERGGRIVTVASSAGRRPSQANAAYAAAKAGVVMFTEHIAKEYVGQPADIVGAVAFYVSDASSWITGTTLDITGGMTL